LETKRERLARQRQLPAAEYSRLVSERDWQSFVTEYAETKGWWVYHTRYSKGSQEGFPDLTLIRPPRLVFAELKREGGRLSPAQRQVLGLLSQIPAVETYTWWPRDREFVIKTLG